VKAEVVNGKHKRITLAELEKHFESAYGIYAGPATNVAEIVFHGIAAHEVASENWHPAQKGEWLPDNTYKLQIPYGYDGELLMDVFRWSDQAEIKSPPELREKAKSLLSRTLQHYKS
jgi:predicted DNA-binding transcriptional regulator YafY